MIKNATYKTIHRLMPIPCVDIVVVWKNRFLLGRRTNQPAKGLWWLPGGRIIKNETIKRAAQRKLREETGLAANDIAYLCTDETIFKKGPFGWPTHSINIVFLAKPASIKRLQKHDGQHSEFEWFSKIRKDWHPYLKSSLKKAGFR